MLVFLNVNVRNSIEKSMFHQILCASFHELRKFLTFVCILQSSTSGASQPAITCSKLTIETLEQGVKYVQC